MDYKSRKSRDCHSEKENPKTTRHPHKPHNLCVDLRTMECEAFDVILSFENDVFNLDRGMGFDEMDCSLSERCDLHKPVKVEMRTHPHSMKQVVNIFIATYRMKTFKQSSKCSRREMLDIIMDSVLEERRISSERATPCYTKSRVLQCSVCDQYQKTVIQSSGDRRVKAAALRAGNIHQKVLFKLQTYVSPSSSMSRSQPVCLGISQSNLYLACTRSDPSDNPKLVLREIDDTLNTIETDDPNGYDDLLFYRKETGVAFNTFESVKFPGWFISTQFDDFTDVEVCQKSANAITSFKLNDQKLL